MSDIKWNQVGVAFLIGLLAGTAMGGFHLRHKLRDHFDKSTPHERHLKRLSSKLDLTTEQKDQIKVIFENKRAKMKSMFAEARPKFEAIRAETRAEVVTILNPEQIKKYDLLDAAMRKRFDKKFSRRL